MMRRILPLALVSLLAACSTRSGSPRDPDLPAGPGPASGTAPAGAAFSPSADPVASLPSSPTVVRYRGPFARAAGVLAFQREADAVVSAAATRLRAEAGLAFPDGRSPRVVVSDDPDTPASGDVSLRVVEGLRRPEIRVPAGVLSQGGFPVKDRLNELVAEAAVLSASPERAPPEWVQRGLPPVFAGTVDRRALDVVLAGDRVRDGEGALAPLDPAFRVLALQRIGLGERVLARFLESRLGGAGDGAALREVGVGSIDFLDAAASTEAARTLERATEDRRISAVAAARAALASGDVDGAGSAVERAVSADAVSAPVDAEIALVRAEISLVRREAKPAARALDGILARPEHVLRLRDARFARALAALGAEDPAARDRAVEFARAWPLDPRTPSIFSDLGVSGQDGVELGVADPATRARAASRIGQAGRPEAAPFLVFALRDGEPSVRRAAVAALGRLAAKDSAEPVDAACADPDAAVRMAALTALVQIDGARGLRRAKQLEADPDADVRGAAATIVAVAEPKPKPRPADVAGPAGPKAPGTAPAGASAPTGTGATRTTGPVAPEPPRPSATTQPPAPGPAKPAVRPAGPGTVSVEPPASPGTAPAPSAPQPPLAPPAPVPPRTEPPRTEPPRTEPPRPPVAPAGTSTQQPPRPLPPPAPLPGSQPPKRPEPEKPPVPGGSPSGPSRPPAPLPPPAPPAEPPKKQ